MPDKRRWIVAGLLVAGTLGLVAAGRLVLARDAGRLNYAVPPGHTQNELTLLLSGTNIELLDTATLAVLESRPLLGTDGVTIQGAPGSVDDALTVDLSGGALALPDGIHFDGGAGGYDSLVMTGGEPAPGSYQATGPNSGILTHGGTRVFFTNLEPVTDTIGATDFFITGTVGNNTINIVNGGSCGLSCLLTQVNSPSFESIAFAHKTNVTVSGLAGADAFTLNNSTPATGLSKLTLDAGGNPNDTIVVTTFNLPGGTLSLRNVITVAQSGVLTVSNLAVQAAGLVNLVNINQVTTVAGGTTNTGAIFTLASSVPTLTVGTVDGVAGITTVNGATQLENFQAGGALVVNSPINTAGGSDTLFADHMTFNAALNAGSGLVYLDKETTAEPISLGTKDANALGLSQTDLNQITASALRVGNIVNDTGGLTVTASISGTAGWSTLDLRQKTNINQNSLALLTVPNLALQTNGGDVVFQFVPNRIGTVAAATLGGVFTLLNGSHITISTVDGLSGLRSAGGGIGVRTTRGGITVDQPVLSGAGSIGLSADETISPTDNLSVSPDVMISSTTNFVTLSAGDNLTLGAGSVVATGGAGNVFLDFGKDDIDGLGDATLAGTVATGGSFSPKIHGGINDATVLVDFTAGASLPNDLDYDGGFGLKGLTMSDAGGSSPHQYFASGSGTNRDFASLIHCTNVQIITVIGGSAADIFDFAPSAGATLHAIGGLPGSPPGDVMSLGLLNATNPTLAITSFDATGATGQWTFGNRQPVDFTGIDTFQNLSHKVNLPVVHR